jgi:hypothetical protein
MFLYLKLMVGSTGETLGSPIGINADHIVELQPDGNHTIVVMANGLRHRVSESYEAIMANLPTRSFH